ncbi:N-acetylmuramoyl-L-alanine amidase family protein [Paenibacillus xerothermodurans]|uniref:AMIN domain-containing protein n=1 Tax=Paenibacillus xerothermodurans TaxID=1977292 RepID=A0A2W1P1G3_PAEXE|nr:N-acetylmuramoyl-L-alanine amidase family protein [Paenibacillus xerothermodurans]PZE20938.1 AMIN domain-containing protein [Paenibacillus xerothermodurans]
MKLRFVSTFILLLLMAIMLPALASAAPQGSADGIPLFFNGKQLKPEVEPRIIKDVAMVPVRIIAEEMGSKVEWDQAAQKVTITKNSTNIQMVIGQPTATVNGTSKTLAAPPLLIAGNTLLPVRFVAENMGIEVDWHEVQRAVYLKEKAAAAPQPAPGSGSGALPTPAGAGVQPPDKPSTDSPVADGNGKPLPVIKTIDMNASQLLIKADSGELKPKVFTMTGPHRIVIDIPNVVLDPSLYKDAATKSGDTVSNNVYVGHVRYSLFNINPHTVRIVLDMKESAELTWESGWNTSALAGVFKKGAKHKVVIDPGHGAHDPGAKSVTGHTEKQFNLAMGLKVFNLLSQEAQIQPLLTRSDDTFVTLDDRVKFANDHNASLFVSIHGNSYRSTSTGTETYYYKYDSAAFAKVMHKHMAAVTGLPDRGVRQQPFRVVKVTNMPAVLLEVGYLSNWRDASLMYDESFQNKVAAAIVAGIKEQLNIQ